MAKRIHLLTLILTCLIFTLPIQPTSAYNISSTSDSTDARVIFAHYLDLDNDGNSDDILTITYIHVPYDYQVVFANITSTLTLPSGQTFIYDLDYTGDFTYMILFVFWYNTALESGWYEIDVDILIHYDGGVLHLTTSRVFDPPEGGDPGPPLMDGIAIAG